MKRKQFEALARRIFSGSTNVAIQGQLVAIVPVGHVLRGLYFEGSSFDQESFYVWAFYLPLFVPAQQLKFNFGKRLRSPGGGDRWYASAPSLISDLKLAVENVALPFLANVDSPESIVRVTREVCDLKDPYAREVIAYALAFSGDVSRAIDELQRLLESLDGDVPWQLEMADRAKKLKSTLTACPDDARQQLKCWEADTARHLQLNRFATEWGSVASP
jgi:hypothetical protein